MQKDAINVSFPKDKLQNDAITLTFDAIVFLLQKIRLNVNVDQKGSDTRSLFHSYNNNKKVVFLLLTMRVTKKVVFLFFTMCDQKSRDGDKCLGDFAAAKT